MSTPTAPGVVTVTPTPADDGEVAAIVAAVRLLQRAEPPRATPARSGWRFAGRWWR